MDIGLNRNVDICQELLSPLQSMCPTDFPTLDIVVTLKQVQVNRRTLSTPQPFTSLPGAFVPGKPCVYVPTK